MKARRHEIAKGADSVVRAMFPEAPARKHAQTRAFDLERFNHLHYQAAFRQVMRLIQAGQPERLIIVTGPTGTGKTTLSKSVYEGIRNDANAGGVDPSIIPCALVRSVTNSLAFDWKDLYIRLLEELLEPDAERQLILPEVREAMLMSGSKMHGESFDLLALRRRLEKTVRKRRTSVIIIDEAHHILIGGRRDQLELQFETIKSFAQMTGAIIVLVGTYELLAIRDLSSQLVRRSEIVHLGRYDSNEPSERLGFADFIKQVTKKLPLPFDPAIQGEIVTDFLYNNSIGTPGIARDLLACALDEALDSRMPSITLELLKRHAKSFEALETLLSAALEGELRMHRSSEDRLLSLLAMPKHKAALALRGGAANDAIAEPPEKASESEKPSSEPPVGQQGRRTPGRRHPVRDPVGRRKIRGKPSEQNGGVVS